MSEQSLIDPMPRWKRKIARLWPEKRLDFDRPKWAKDVIVSTTQVRLSLIDRIRVLFSGKIRIDTHTAIEYDCGMAVAKSTAYPEYPDFLLK